MENYWGIQVFGEKPRIEQRTKVTVLATLRDRGPQRDICILDVSTRGVLATTANPPKFGEFVEIVVRDKSLVGHVKWSGNRRFGIVLQDRISVINFLSGKKGSINLPKQRRFVLSSKGAAAIHDYGANIARLAQFAFLVILAGFAAVTIAHGIGLTLGSIELPN